MGFVDEEFEGYLPPTELEIERALSTGMVVVDANVLLDLYRQPAAAREKALNYLRRLGDRLWVPHQVVREFWRNRSGRLIEARKPDNPLLQVRAEIRTHLNRLTPTTGSDPELDRLRDAVLNQIEELDQQILRATGEPIDVDASIRDPRTDPVVVALREILDGKVGKRPQDEDQMIQEGLKRFKSKIPPGFIDGEKKSEQVPERGTGDYLAWEETLRHMATMNLECDFIFVSRDEKADWRILIDKSPMGALPQLVEEARARVGQRVIILSPPSFYTLLATLASEVDSEAVESLIASSASSNEPPHADDWNSASVAELVSRLEDEGYTTQAEAVLIASASPDGFVSRNEVYRIGGYDPTRSLRRFTLPARRIALALVDDGLLDESADPPLTAVYNGPGPATGFIVPPAMVRSAESFRRSTWVAAASQAANTEPERWWTVAELVAKVDELGLRDLSSAKTPEATLRRDLKQRQTTVFVTDGTGRWRLRGDDGQGA